MTRACLLDLDRTLVRVNTASLYARWQVREGEARRRDAARVAWWIARYTLGLIDAESIARSLARPMAGREEARFAERVERWVRDEVLPHVAPAALDEIARRKADGYLCAIVTASTSYSAEPVGRAVAIEHVLSSRLEVEGGVFTGEVVPPFCYGEGKVVAVETWARAHGVDLGRSAFFTDSISDLPLLERVGEPVAVNPDPRLRWVARRRAWPIRTW
jgi:HAD superfamily hydrolase (TIGR01490 family)